MTRYASVPLALAPLAIAFIAGCFETPCKRDVRVLVIDASRDPVKGASVTLDELCCSSFAVGDPRRCVFRTNEQGTVSFELGEVWECSLSIKHPAGATTTKDFNAPHCAQDISVTVELRGGGGDAGIADGSAVG
jgi:hypothetical protein